MKASPTRQGVCHTDFFVANFETAPLTSAYIQEKRQRALGECSRLNSSFAGVNGTSLHYEITGKGPMLVLIHANMVDMRMWDEQVPVLNPHYEVIRYDVRGYGKSSLPLQPYSHYEDLRGLLDFLGVEETHIVGLSLGGAIGLDFAIVHPDRVKSLVIVPGGTGLKKWPKDLSEGFDAFVQVAKSGDLARANRMMMEFAPMIPAGKIAAVKRRLDQMLADYSWAHFIGQDREVALNPPAEEQIAKLRVPLLIVHGGLDVGAFLEGGKWLQENVPNAERVVIPGAGHAVNMERPEEFNRLILDFLRRH